MQTKENSNDETLKLLSYKPARLGHATFLSEEARGIVTDNNICVEICLSSNLLYVLITEYGLQFTKLSSQLQDCLVS